MTNAINHVNHLRDIHSRADRECWELRRAVDASNRLRQQVADYLDADIDIQQREESRARMTLEELKDHHERNDVPDSPRPRAGVPMNGDEP